MRSDCKWTVGSFLKVLIKRVNMRGHLVTEPTYETLVVLRFLFEFSCILSMVSFCRSSRSERSS
mgnify:CR=1 FL=1